MSGTQLDGKEQEQKEGLSTRHMPFHPLALRYSWLERFVEGFDGGAALALLPNYVYSLALARFWQEQQQQQRATAAAGASTSTAAAAAGDEDDSGGAAGAHPSSHDSLVSAMLLYPMVVPQLMARLQGQGVGKDSYWKSLLDRRLFKEAGDGGSATLSHLVSIFVERSHLLWKAADVQVGGGQGCEQGCCWTQMHE